MDVVVNAQMHFLNSKYLKMKNYRVDFEYILGWWLIHYIPLFCSTMYHLATTVVSRCLPVAQIAQAKKSTWSWFMAHMAHHRTVTQLIFFLEEQTERDEL